MGFGFNRRILTGLLRGELGFDGVICTDWGLVTGTVIFGKPLPARAWGVEHLDRLDRLVRIVEAGADQLGGEKDTDMVMAALEAGLLTTERIRESAVRIVQMMLDLDLVGHEASALIGEPELPAAADVELGLQAQTRALTVLTNAAADSAARLPLRSGLDVHLVGLSPEEVPTGWRVVPAAEADVIVMRVSAPFELRDHFFLEKGMHQGSLDFPAEVPAEVRRLAEAAPIVLVVQLDRPAILTPLIDSVATLVADFGASDAAVVEGLTGRIIPEGRLPFESARARCRPSPRRRRTSPTIRSTRSSPLGLGPRRRHPRPPGHPR